MPSGRTLPKDARAATGAKKQSRQKVEQCRIALPQWVTCKVKNGDYKAWWCRACDKWLHCWPGDANYVGSEAKLRNAILCDEHVKGGVHKNKIRHFSLTSYNLEYVDIATQWGDNLESPGADNSADIEWGAPGLTSMREAIEDAAKSTPMDAADTPSKSDDSWQMRPPGEDTDRLHLLEKQIDLLRERIDGVENDKTGSGYCYPEIEKMNKDIVAETDRVNHLFERLDVLERMVDDKFSGMQEKLSDMQRNLSDMHDNFVDVSGEFSTMQDQIDERVGNGQSGSSKGRMKRK